MKIEQMRADVGAAPTVDRMRENISRQSYHVLRRRRRRRKIG